MVMLRLVFQIHVVDEQRVYAAWSEGSPQRGEVNRKSGIIDCKSVLNKLHYELGANGFSQVCGKRRLKYTVFAWCILYQSSECKMWCSSDSILTMFMVY